MKRVFAIFSECLIAVIIIGYVMYLLFTNGSTNNVNAELAKHGEVDHINYSEYTDGQAAASYAALDKPSISLAADEEYEINTVYEVTDIFLSMDTNNNNLSIRIEDINKSDGTSCMDIYNSDNEEICFTLPGTYEFKISSTDSNNHTSKKNFVVRVNR